jgi:hypothetical protein
LLEKGPAPGRSAGARGPTRDARHVYSPRGLCSKTKMRTAELKLRKRLPGATPLVRSISAIRQAIGMLRSAAMARSPSQIGGSTVMLVGRPLSQIDRLSGDEGMVLIYNAPGFPKDGSMLT